LVAAGLALALVLVVGAVAIAPLLKASTAPQFSMSLPSAWKPISHQSVTYAAIWIVLALLATFVSVKLSMRLASGRA
jgi:hypothetical protein